MELAGVESRIADRIVVDPETGCHLWTGSTTADGYGTVSVGGRTRLVHRYVYERVVGPIPPKHVLDHLNGERGPCRHRNCANCAHLQPTTVELNSKAVVPWNRKKTHCPANHAYAEHGVSRLCGDGRTRRFCRECERNRSHARRHAPGTQN